MLDKKARSVKRQNIAKSKTEFLKRGDKSKKCLVNAIYTLERSVRFIDGGSSLSTFPA